MSDEVVHAGQCAHPSISIYWEWTKNIMEVVVYTGKVGAEEVFPKKRVEEQETPTNKEEDMRGWLQVLTLLSNHSHF